MLQLNRNKLAIDFKEVREDNVIVVVIDNIEAISFTVAKADVKANAIMLKVIEGVIDDALNTLLDDLTALGEKETLELPQPKELPNHNQA